MTINQVTYTWIARRAVVVVAMLALAGYAGAADWPQWRGPNRSGVSVETNWQTSWPPKTLWKVNVGEGYSSPVVSKGRVFVTGHTRGGGGRGTDNVYCFDAQSGKELWKYSFNCLSSRKDRTKEYTGPRATPLVDGNRVYIVSLEGHLFCLDTNTGKVIWSKPKKGLGVAKGLKRYSVGGDMLYGFCSSPVISGDIIICSVKGAIMALNKETGKPIWRCKGGGAGFNGPSPMIVKVNGATCVVFGNKNLVMANVDEKGKKMWEHPMGRISVSSPLVFEDKIFFSTYPNKGKCELIQAGTTKPTSVWENRAFQVYHLGNPVLWKGYLYGLDCSRTEFSYSDGRVASLKCLDFKTGAVKWTQKGMGWGQVIVADGKLLIQKESGELIVVKASPEGYQELGRAEALKGPCWAIPALADGKIYCRSNAGVLVCLSAVK